MAGHPNRSAAKTITIATNGGYVNVLESESLSAEEVKQILAGFATQTGKPAVFTWPDITERFE